jgi:hypothetical protein
MQLATADQQGATSMKNEELVKRMIESKAINFDAIGQLVNTHGAELAASTTHINFLIIGKPFLVACFMPAFDAAQLVGQFRGAEIGAAISKPGLG